MNAITYPIPHDFAKQRTFNQRVTTWLDDHLALHLLALLLIWIGYVMLIAKVVWST